MKVAIKMVKTTTDFKVLHISGEPGDTLENHKVNQQALLLMRTGNIIYKEGDKTTLLSAGESCDIPAEVFHNVTCTTNTHFFVVMPDSTKMRFKNEN